MQAAAGSLVAGVSGSSGAQGAVDIEPRSKQNRRSPNVEGQPGHSVPSPTQSVLESSATLSKSQDDSMDG